MVKESEQLEGTPKNMPFPIPGILSNLWKHQPRAVMPSPHLMLTGINQKVFFNQWGTPEIKISLDNLQGVYQFNALSLMTDCVEGSQHSVWIYEKKNKILFFRRGTLISHFKWREFKEKWKRPKGEMDPGLIKKPSVLMATTLSPVA